MKFRAAVTQYFSFTDSSQNNPGPRVCSQQSWAQAAAGSPGVPHASRSSPCSVSRAERIAIPSGRGGLGGKEMGPLGHPWETLVLEMHLWGNARTVLQVAPCVMQNREGQAPKEWGRRDGGLGSPPGLARTQPPKTQSQKRWWSRS